MKEESMNTFHLSLDVPDAAARGAGRGSPPRGAGGARGGGVGPPPPRLEESGLATFDERDTVCCYARPDKVWVTDPAGNAWEVYTLLEDVDEEDEHEHAAASSSCCAPGCCGR